MRTVTGRTPARGIGIRVGAALVTGVTLGNLGSNLMPVLLPGMAERFHLTGGEAGSVATLQLFATALATLALTSRAARPGRARMAGLGLVATLAGFCLASAAPDLAVLSAANILAGAGLGAVNAAATSAIAATDDTDRASSVAVVGGTLVLAALVIVLPMSNNAWGGTAAFTVLAACCLPAVWLVRALPDAAEPGSEAAPKTPIPLMFLLALALLGAADQGAWSYSEVLGEKYAGMPSSLVSIVLAIASIASLAGVGLARLATPRAGVVRTITGLVALEGLAKLFIAAVPWGPCYIAAAVIWQICFMGLLVSVLAVAAAADSSGRWVAASSGALAIGTGLGTAPAGWILDSWGAPAFGLVLAVATAVGGIPLLRTTRAAEAE